MLVIKMSLYTALAILVGFMVLGMLVPYLGNTIVFLMLLVPAFLPPLVISKILKENGVINIKEKLIISLLSTSMLVLSVIAMSSIINKEIQGSGLAQGISVALVFIFIFVGLNVYPKNT